ncbi:MAG: hypothetical protein HC923_13095 [Myxococcales bacterium]|nr:hypothetical protein [Myxococcales bacterium]
MQPRRYATGLTMALFVGICVALSALPVPEWLKPLDVFEADRPVHTFVARF